jgi:uncharacterized protein
MHFTLHLTTGCNLNCSYCYSPPLLREDMNENTLLQSIHFAASISRNNAGIIFFGGEPLLCQDMIFQAINECKLLEKSIGFVYHTKMVTNGMLLDEPFIKKATDLRLSIALSFDGIKNAHDAHRQTPNHQSTFDKLDSISSVLLRYQPYANVLLAVTTRTASYYAASVHFLFNKGFKYLIASVNYADEWTDQDLAILKKEYLKIADLYQQWTLAGKKFYFSPFEVKLATHIKRKDAQCFRCALAQHQISIAPDGKLYPCVQFVGNGHNHLDYSIGDIQLGINEQKRIALFEQSKIKDEACADCALNHRCNNDCSCLNWQTTGNINKISPLLCESERMLIPIVDKLGKELFQKKAQTFIQKHYNPSYPYLSLFEDASCLL